MTGVAWVFAKQALLRRHLQCCAMCDQGMCSGLLAMQMEHL